MTRDCDTPLLDEIDVTEFVNHETQDLARHWNSGQEYISTSRCLQANREDDVLRAAPRAEREELLADEVEVLGEVGLHDDVAAVVVIGGGKCKRLPEGRVRGARDDADGSRQGTSTLPG